MRSERLASCTDCQWSRKRVSGDTITQSEWKIFDKSSENQLSSEIDASRRMFEPAHALPAMLKEMSVHIINNPSED